MNKRYGDLFDNIPNPPYMDLVKEVAQNKNGQRSGGNFSAVDDAKKTKTKEEEYAENVQKACALFGEVERNIAALRGVLYLLTNEK